MIPTPTLHRREFILSTVAAVAASVTSHAQPARRIPLIGFIKPFQKLSYAEIADISAEIGWDGIECPLRKGGTIEPPAVEDELPKLVEALKRNQLAIQVIATDVDDARDPLADRLDHLLLRGPLVAQRLGLHALLGLLGAEPITAMLRARTFLGLQRAELDLELHER